MSRTAFFAMVGVIVAAVAYSQTRDGADATPQSKESAMNTAATPSSQGKLDPNTVDLDKVDPETVDWSKVDWKKRLTPEQYFVTRQAGTERAFTGEYDDLFEDGQYRCVNCGLPLFESVAKFNSHCGWPSFDKTLAKDSVLEIADKSLGMVRTEVRCRRCGAHLGHVFDDGPTATGIRYCMNSAALKFVPDEAVKADAEKRAKEGASSSTTKDAKSTK